MPKVSVILTSFNHKEYLREAIDSVLNQSFTDFELIIWDDASSDNSWDLINQYRDPRIKAFRNDKNRGAVYGINKAISEVATGKYIAIHHSDDIWELDKLEKQVAYLEAHSEIGAVFTNALAIAEDGSPLTNEKHFYFNIFDQPNRSRYDWLNRFFNRGNALCHPSVLIRKSCYTDCGLYRLCFAQIADFDMWIRLCLKHEIHILPEKLVRFRVRDNEVNASGNRPEMRIRVLYELYKTLDHYKKLKKYGDLIKVFPSAARFNRNEETDMDFALAMVALEQKSFSFTQLFGLDLLFEMLSDPVRSANIRRLYDFDSKSFIELTAKHDVFSREEISALYFALTERLTERDGSITRLNQIVDERDRQIAERDRQMAERDRQINAIMASRSWKLTAPLRFISTRLRALHPKHKGFLQNNVKARKLKTLHLKHESFLQNNIKLQESSWTTIITGKEAKMIGTKKHNYEYEFDLSGENAAAKVVRMVGRNKRVLEIGAGPGSITKILKQNNGCRITAVEIDSSAIAKLSEFCDAVYQCDLNAPEWTSELSGCGTFDVVVAADVFEHLYNPEKTLADLKPFFSLNGYLVISLPHVGNNAIIASILDGDFEYRDFGLLDKTHIRFFGVKNMQKLIENSGYKIIAAEFVINPPKQTELAAYWQKLPASIKSALSKNRYGSVYQVVMKVAPATSELVGLHLADIPVPSYVATPLKSLKALLSPYLSPKMRFRLRLLATKFGLKI